MKNPARWKRTGFEGNRVVRFRGGHAAFHRFDRAGGEAFGAACCRVRLTHSRSQETSAGRNLITVFFTVNNLQQKFFRRAAAAAVAGRASDARRADPGMHPRASNSHPMHRAKPATARLCAVCTRSRACIRGMASIRARCPSHHRSAACGTTANGARISRRTSRFAQPIRANCANFRGYGCGANARHRQLVDRLRTARAS